MQLNITKGKINRAQKVVIYGSEGIGKSTLAAEFPSPLFIDMEGGTSHLDVARIARPADFEALLETVNAVAEQNVCKTLVIDTADWTEQLCVEAILKKYRQTSIESFGYGKGYTYLSEEMTRLLHALDGVIASGKNVVLVAHAKMRKQELPDEQGAFDRWEMKLSRQVSPLVKEWADLLLFLNYKTVVVHTDSNTNKAQGGKRVMYTTHHPCWDAKNRHGLPDEVELSFESIRSIFEDVPTPKTPAEQLADLMARDQITEAQIRQIVPEKNLPANVPLSDYAPKLIKSWAKIVSKLNPQF